MFDPQKILILAPHPDDGELGLGGSIAKFCAEKKEVHYAGFSLCRKSLSEELDDHTLENECKHAVRRLGMDTGKLMFYDFEVREFPKYRQEILEELVSLNKYIKPDLVFVPAASDDHQDHDVIHTEGLRAFKRSSVMGYEMPWNNRKIHTQLFISLTEAQVQHKIDALAEYRSQTHRSYMEADFIRSLAKVRGVQCNAEWAEAFEVYRWLA